MRGLSVAIVAVALLAGSTIGVAAQEPDAASRVTPVHGSWLSAKQIEPGQEMTVDGVLQIRERETEDAWEWSDPRLPTTLSSNGNFDNYGVDASSGPATQSAVMWGSLESPDGLWRGTYTGAQYVDEAAGTWAAARFVLIGQGERAGTFATIYLSLGDDGSPTHTGAIFEGQAPPSMGAIE
jgi:hypothetical protein